MSNEFNEKNIHQRWIKASNLLKEIATIRTGRANTNMLDTIKVDVYGQLMPVDQLATISVPEARLISIQVWDKANINLIESAIQKSELGVNPQIDGQIIRLRIRSHRRKKKRINQSIKKHVRKRKKSQLEIFEEANEDLKKLKDKIISEDNSKNFENIQKLTDSNIENIDKILSDKEKEIIQI